MKTQKNKYRGIIGTILFHGFLILCIIFFAFHSPLPPPPDEGMEIDLGYGDFGGTGDVKLMQPSTDQAAKASAVKNATNNNVVTQNTEESASLNKKNNTNTTTDTKQDDQINKNAFYSGKKNNGGGSYGNSGGPGSGPGKNPGIGGGQNGISYDLKGRSFKILEKPAYNSKEEGTVVVTIWVDKQGNVTKATAGARGTTTTDKTLWKSAELAALKSKCHIKSDAPEQQTGTITYIFITN